MTTIHLEGRDIPAFLRGGYSGNKFQVRVCETVTIPADAGLWSGGSRSQYVGVDMVSYTRYPLSYDNTSPWNEARKEHTVKLEPGKAIVEHSMFCGKDMGLRIYIHPDNATKLLPVKVELDPVEQLVLNATASYKSSYNGKDRYQMATEYSKNPPSRTEWSAAKESLRVKGLLDARGAITVKGKNAVTR